MMEFKAVLNINDGNKSKPSKANNRKRTKKKLPSNGKSKRRSKDTTKTKPKAKSKKNKEVIEEVSIIDLKTAYEFFTIQCTSKDINDPIQFVMPRYPAKITNDPLTRIYSVVKDNKLLKNCYTSCNIKRLRTQLTTIIGQYAQNVNATPGVAIEDKDRDDTDAHDTATTSSFTPSSSTSSEDTDMSSVLQDLTKIIMNQCKYPRAKNNNKTPSKTETHASETKLINKLCDIKTVYYNLVFDGNFRNDVLNILGPIYPQYVSLTKDNVAHTTQGILCYAGRHCIECKEELKYCYRTGTTAGKGDRKGSAAIARYRTKCPKIINIYLKKCENCNISYSHNRIDYPQTHPKHPNTTLFLDPDAFNHYWIGWRNVKNVFHKSMHKSISDHQYSNKSTAMDTWLKHYNEDWKDDYKELFKLKGVKEHFGGSAELGYSTVMRYYWFVSLLRRIRDLDKFGVIDMDGKPVKIALRVTNEDTDAIQKELDLLTEIKSTSNSINNSDKNTPLSVSPSTPIAKSRGTATRSSQRKIKNKNVRSSTRSSTSTAKPRVTAKRRSRSEMEEDTMENCNNSNVPSPSEPSTKRQRLSTTPSKTGSTSTTSSPSQKSSKSKVISSIHLFGYFVRKFENELLNQPTDAISEVPVRLKGDGVIEIFPGWFIVYGDGAEKITRLRCSYPQILSKLDYIQQLSAEATSKQALNQNDEDEITDETKINDIGDDHGAIDLTKNNNSFKYSKQRYYECANSPYCNDPDNQRKSYKCCKHHVAKLVQHGIAFDEVSQFIEWYKLHHALAKLNAEDVKETICKSYDVDEDVIDSIKTKKKQKIADIEAKIAAFKIKSGGAQLHIKFAAFVDSIHDKINEVSASRANASSKSSRQSKKRQQSRAKAQESNRKDKSQDVVQQLNKILGDDGEWDHEIVHSLKMGPLELLSMELNSNKYLDKIKGCRKSKNISGATMSRTKGLNGTFNTSGVMLALGEEIVRETPTAVILQIADVMTNNQASMDYANRIEGIGYDMMCRIYHHLDTLMEDDRLSDVQKHLWCSLMPRAFIDIWHIFTHTDDLCSTDGIFHPTLNKFKDILYFDGSIDAVIKRVNDQIVEQFWSTMNSTYQLKSMNREHLLMFLLEKRQYYNNNKIAEIKEKGWTFVPIDCTTKLHNIGSNTAARYAKWPNETELKAKRDVPLTKVKIEPSKRTLVLKLIADDQEKRKRSEE